MIKVSVLYPNGANSNFDMNYYLTKNPQMRETRADALGRSTSSLNHFNMCAHDLSLFALQWLA